MNETIPAIKNHSTQIFFPFHFPTDSQMWVEEHILKGVRGLTLFDLIENNPLRLPASLLKALKNKQALRDKKVWVDADIKPSQDLHEHLRELIHPAQQDYDKNKPFMGHAPLEICPEVINLLSGGNDKLGQGLMIPLAKSAAQRLGIPIETHEKKTPAHIPIVPLCIERVLLFLFGTGIGVVVSEVRCQPPGKKSASPEPDYIVEGNYVLSRAGKQGVRFLWTGSALFSKEECPKHAPDAFTLEEMVTAFVPPLKKGECNPNESFCVSTNWQRFFTFTTVQFSEPVKDITYRNSLAYRLAKKYTDNYLLGDEKTARELYIPFKNIVHCITLEGGAIISEMAKDKNGKEIPFLSTYQSNVINTYFPLALIAYQEYLALLYLIPRKKIMIETDAPSEQTIQELKRLLKQFMRFRLHSRFSVASLITMHNDVYLSWRNVFSLDRILSEISDDTKEAASYLDMELERLYSARQQKMHHTQTAIGIGMGSLIFLTGIYGTNVVELSNNSWKDIFLSWMPGCITWSIILSGVTGACVYLKKAYKNLRK